MSRRAQARQRGEYIPPSVLEALESCDKRHPRAQGPRGPRPYPLNISVGDVGKEFGPGVALYFNFLNWMAATFFMLFVLNLPTIVVVHAARFYGPYSTAHNSTGYRATFDGQGGFDMGSTTLGAIAPDDVEEGSWIAFDNGSTVHTISKLDFLNGSAAMDVLGSWLFLCMAMFFARRQKQIERAVDQDTIEICDYTVTVKAGGREGEGSSVA
jgi:hypothetical protein